MSFNIITRGICTTASRYGKRNFRKFPLYNKRGSRLYKKEQAGTIHSDMPIYTRNVRPTGYYDENGKFVLIPEMVPELIVPDLTDFNLKPYVSYRVRDVVQSEFTSEDLFSAMYAPKIVEDFNSGKLNEDGSPKEPSENEKLTAEEVKLKARQTGSDIF